MASLNTMTSTLKQPTINPSLVCLSNSSLSLANMTSFQREYSAELCFLGKCTKGRISAANSKRIYPISKYQGQWEDPDDSSGYAYDDSDNEDAKEDIEQNDLDFESDWETENDGKVIVSSVSKSPQTSMKNISPLSLAEIEQLLSPDERAILDRIETPELEKISTAKWNPLHTFALAGQIKFMDELLENGMDVDQVDEDGLTALHHATIGNRESVICYLLKKEANPQARDLDGASPLHYAVQMGAMQTVKILIKYNVDVNIADDEGWTPLHIAMQTRNRDIAKVLLINGADRTRKNKDGKTPWDLSLCYGRDFKSYYLAKLLKFIPPYRDL